MENAIPLRSGLLACVAILIAAAKPGMAQSPPWWDNYPRIISTDDVQTALAHHANIGFTSARADPGWGTFGQDAGARPSVMSDFHSHALKDIGYFEAFGEAMIYVAELGNKPPGGCCTPLLHTHWWWESYSGGPIGWIGVQNFFDDAAFAQPYTLTHPRYSSPPMTYPDGMVATGYSGDPADPRNSRIFDAGCSKDVLGSLDITYSYNSAVNAIDPNTGQPAGPLNGLFYVPASGQYCSLFSIGKDAACPCWIDYTHASALMAADNGLDGMWTDNYCGWDSFGFPIIKKAFGEWSVARFHDYLSTHFSAAELTAMGISSVSTFDIRASLRNKAAGWGWNGWDLDSAVWNDSRWLSEPLWRAYVIFQRQTGTQAIAAYYNALKTAALQAGKSEFLVAGNDVPSYDGWCRAGPSGLTPLDMVSTELSVGWNLLSGPRGFMIPPIGRSAPLYKLAREHAAGRFVNVWLYRDGYPTELSHPGVCTTMYYEMLASHALPKFDPSNPNIAGTASANASFFQFVEQAALVYGSRKPVADVGIYYSSSSILTTLTPAGYLDHGNQPHQFGHWGWATALGELQYQYQAVPEWKLADALSQGIRVLIIPESEVFDEGDVATVLMPWVQNGGLLIVTGVSGKRRGEAHNFELNPGGFTLASLTSVGALANTPPQTLRSVGAGKVLYLRDNIGLVFFNESTQRTGLLPQFASAMNTVLAGTDPVWLTPGAGVTSDIGLTLYHDLAARRVFVDVNNYAITPATDAITPTPATTFTIARPSWLNGCTLSSSVLAPDSPAPAASMDASVPGRISVSLGPVRYYASVVITGATQCHQPSQDVDGDGDVDTTDFEAFAACCSGPGRPYSPDADPVVCACLDIDCDGDVDLDDFGAFQRCYSGLGNHADPNCRP